MATAPPAYQNRVASSWYVRRHPTASPQWISMNEATTLARSLLLRQASSLVIEAAAPPGGTWLGGWAHAAV